MRTLLYHIIYHPAINRVLRTVNKWLMPVTSFQLPPSGAIDLRLRSGLTFRLQCNPTSHVSKVLFYHGPDAFEYTSIFERLIARCQSFADVGANIGYYSVLASRINPAIRVISFEPAPGPLHYLKANLAVNQVESSVQVSAIALSNVAGKLSFSPAFNPKYKYLPHHLGGTGHAAAGDQAAIEVQSDTLDRILGDKGIDLIKLDTEGTEDKILEGAANIIRTYRPIIICETLFNKIENALESVMLSHGYDFYNHQQGKLVKTLTIRRVSDNGVRDCFFVPKEKTSWIQEFMG